MKSSQKSSYKSTQKSLQKEFKIPTLTKDVAFNGLLITYFGEPSGNDTGLRFKETENDKIYICPNCGKDVEEPEPEDIDFE